VSVGTVTGAPLHKRSSSFIFGVVVAPCAELLAPGRRTIAPGHRQRAQVRQRFSLGAGCSGSGAQFADATESQRACLSVPRGTITASNVDAGFPPVRCLCPGCRDLISLARAVGVGLERPLHRPYSPDT